MSELIIGIASEIDKSDIFDLMSASLEDEYGLSKNHQARTNKLINYYFNRNDSVIFIGKINGSFAGFTWLIESEDIICSEPYYCVLYLAVKEKFRGHGFGKALMQKIIDYARENNIHDLRLSVRVENKIAQNIYQSLGYQVFKQEMKLQL